MGIAVRQARHCGLLDQFVIGPDPLGDETQSRRQEVLPITSHTLAGRSRGFFVRVIFVCVESPDMNIGRVLLRVAQGGHEVPLSAIPLRYERSLASIPGAVRIADQALLFDNSVRHQPHRLNASFKRGELVAARRAVPDWAQRVFGAEFDRFRSP
jgi:predicted ABC-type ATPase